MFFTILAYVLLLTIVPMLSGLAGFLFLPLVAVASRKGMSSYWVAWLNGLMMGSLAVGLGWLLFYLMGVDFGLLATLLLFLAYLRNGSKRIQTKPDTPAQMGYLAGDLSSIATAGFYLSAPEDPLLAILVGGVAFIIVIGVYRRFVANGNIAFWAAVQQYPEEAKGFFFNENDWVFVNAENYDSLKSGYEGLGYVGPFRHSFDVGDVYLYYKGNDINKSQEKFTSSLQATLSAVDNHKL